MNKNEKQQLEAIHRYLKDGFQYLNCGRISLGVSNVEKAEILLDVLMTLADKKPKR